jgi:uncharacterized protein YuzE
MYRHERAIVAYYRLPRHPRQTITSTRRAELGLNVDLDAKGRLLGIEITAPSKLNLAALNRLLRNFGCAPLRRADLRSLEWR